MGDSRLGPYFADIAVRRLGYPRGIPSVGWRASAQQTAGRFRRSRNLMPVEHLDVLIVGAGLSGVGAAYHLMKHCPGKSFAPARRARGDGRYLGPVPLPRHPFRLGHVHPRLQLQAMERSQGHRRRSVDPPLHRGDRTGERHRPEDPLPPPGAQGRLGFRQCALEPRRAARRRARAAAHDRAVPADVHRLLPLRGRLYPGIRRSRGLRRAGRPSAAVARGPRLQRQEGGGDR